MLDNENIYAEIDPDGMLELLRAFPAQLIEGRQLAGDADISAIDPDKIANIVVCGMGGSAIGGDLVKSYTIGELRVPIFTNRDYSLPEFVNGGTLIIGCSYSGNTEETLEAFSAAGKRGAQRAVITTGGRLAEIAESEGIPIIKIPGGLPPRAALGLSISPLLALLERLGLIPNQSTAVNDAYIQLLSGVENYDTEVSTNDNAAKILAYALYQKLPLIYSDSLHFDSVAVRFRGQINENAKQLAYSATLPENNHNELVGWKNIGPLDDILISICLKDRKMNDRVVFRMRFMAEVQEKLGVEAIVLESIGDTLLARMFSLIQLGDWASYYLAILNKENPMPVKIIDKLKSELKKV